MKTQIIHIKNMVCPRCVTAVKNIMDKLNIDCLSVNLGEVVLNKSLSLSQLIELSKALIQQGFELLEDSKSKTIAKIKSTIIQQIHQSNEDLKVNYSTLLSNQLNQEYTAISKLFSSVEGITIEKYIVKQKIEKVKELLIYNELTLSQIADELNYSSVAHLSTQFKKETGMTPSVFKKNSNPNRKTLDSI